jgi:predicted ThiF/HesA family dinucleotide-utilizing enzyme
MCISAQEVNMGTLLSNIITSVNEGGGTGFVPVATVEVAGKVKASSEVVVSTDGVMGIGEIEKGKIIGLEEELNSLNQDIKSIMETGVTSTVVEKLDSVESSVATVEQKMNTVETKLATMEEDITWGNF